MRCKRWFLLSFLISVAISLFAGDTLMLIFPQLKSTDLQDSLHGDCAIMVAPTGETLMIDCGHPKTAETVKLILSSFGITQLDGFVATHQHIDHIGAFPSLAESIPIKQIYKSPVEYDSSVRSAFLNAVENQKIPMHTVSAGDTIQLGSEITIEVLWPEKEYTLPNAISNSFVNNHSLVLKVMYGDSSVLFAGDLYTWGERNLLNLYSEEQLDCDITKANHHGKNTSNQRSWMQAVSPNLVICTSDGAVDPTLFARLSGMNIDLLQTAIDGNVIIELTDDKQYTFTTQQNLGVMHE